MPRFIKKKKNKKRWVAKPRSLNKEDPAISTNSVRPAVRQGVPAERRRHDRSDSARSLSRSPQTFPGSPDTTHRQGCTAFKGEEYQSRTSYRIQFLLS